MSEDSSTERPEAVSLPVPPPPQQPMSPVLASSQGMGGASSPSFSFDGGAGTYVGTAILAFLVTLCSLGFAFPFALVLRQRWQAKHTFVEGRQLKFTGTGLGLFGNWIKWFLLTIITLGIYSFWVGPRIVKWTVEHQEFAPSVGGAGPVPNSAAGRDTRPFSFDGGAGTYVGTAILAFLVTLCSLGFAFPFALVLRQRWQAKHTFVEGRQLKFTGTGLGLFGNWIKWFLLTIITLGIYSFWVGPRIVKWTVEHQEFAVA